MVGTSRPAPRCPQRCDQASPAVHIRTPRHTARGARTTKDRKQKQNKTHQLSGQSTPTPTRAASGCSNGLANRSPSVGGSALSQSPSLAGSHHRTGKLHTDPERPKPANAPSHCPRPPPGTPQPSQNSRASAKAPRPPQSVHDDEANKRRAVRIAGNTKSENSASGAKSVPPPTVSGSGNKEVWQRRAEGAAQRIRRPIGVVKE